jgi:hypothetical protein
VLEVVVDFNGAYSGERPAYTLRAPDGTVTSLRDFVGNRVTVAHPMPGAWVLERVQAGTTPTVEAGTLELSAVSHG